MTIRARSGYFLVGAAVNAGTSIVLLPLTTRVLGPADYGLYALVLSLMAFGTSLATLGSGFRVFSLLPEPESAVSRAALTTMLVFATATTLGWAGLVTGGYVVGRTFFDEFHQLPPAALALAIVGMLASPAWVIASDVLTLRGQARFFAAAAILQGVVAAAATLFTLFVLDGGVASLFAGYAVGSLSVLLASIRALRHDLRLASLSEQEVATQLRTAREFLTAQMSEVGYALTERTALTAGIGLGTLGLYTHSQRYRDLSNLAVKSVSRAVWPTTLDEARDPARRFSTTGLAWQSVHIGFTVAALLAVAYGDILIAALTNDRFTAASVYLAPWFIIGLLQNTARAQLGVLYAFGEGRTLGRIATATNVSAFVALVVLIPPFGAGGALLAVLVQHGLQRSLFHVSARRYGESPVQDGFAILGIALIATVGGVKYVLEPGLLGDGLLFLTATGAMTAAGWSVLRQAARTLRPGGSAGTRTTRTS